MKNFLDSPDNPTLYKIKVFDDVYTDWQRCPLKLVWNSTYCRCDWPTTQLDCKCCHVGLMRHEKDKRFYKQYTNGAWEEKSCVGSTSAMIWDDENCLCKWDKDTKTATREPFKRVPVPECKSKLLIFIQKIHNEC